MTAAEVIPHPPSQSSRMFALQPPAAHVTSGSSSVPRDVHAAAMSRVPIAALLRPDTVSVEKFLMHGRTYYKYKNDMYNFPADDAEYERLDILHQLIYLVALNKQLHLASLRSSPRRVLDIGFGTGFWMMEMEKLYPTAEIIGFDLDNAVLETRGNSRCAYNAPVDFTAPKWPVDDMSVDLCHMAQLCGCVPNWLDHYGKAFRSLRPGIGQIEHIEIDWTPRTLQPQFPGAAKDMHDWWYWMTAASQRAGKSVQYREDTENLLEQAGFVDVSHKRVRIPLYTNGQKDKREWALAHGYQTAMGHIGTESFTGFSTALFTRYIGFTPEQVQAVCDKVVQVIGQRDLPLYINLHVWTARRPQG